MQFLCSELLLIHFGFIGLFLTLKIRIWILTMLHLYLWNMIWLNFIWIKINNFSDLLWIINSIYLSIPLRITINVIHYWFPPPSWCYFLFWLFLLISINDIWFIRLNQLIFRLICHLLFSIRSCFLLFLIFLFLFIRINYFYFLNSLVLIFK